MNSGVSALVRPLPPKRKPDRSLKARQHTTTSATPAATAMAACATVPAAAPPPCGTREKKFRSPMPTVRATAISSLESMVNVTMPSTSLGDSPASSSAALTDSHANCSSLRPDSLENSVWPIPAMAVVPASFDGGAGDVIAEVVGRLEGHLDEVLAAGSLDLAGDAAGETQRVVRKRRHAKANRQLGDHCLGPGPVGQEPHAVAVGGQDVHEQGGGG